MIMYVIFLAIFRGPPIYPRCQSSPDASRMSVHSKLARKKLIDNILKDLYSNQMKLTTSESPSPSLSTSATCLRLIVPEGREVIDPCKSTVNMTVTRGSGSLPGPGVHHLVNIGDSNSLMLLGVETGVTPDTSPSVIEILLLYDDFIVYFQSALSLRLSQVLRKVVLHDFLCVWYVSCSQVLTRHNLISATWLATASIGWCNLTRRASRSRPQVVYVHVNEVKHSREEQINAHDFIIDLTSECDDCLIATDLTDHKFNHLPMYDCPALHRPVEETITQFWPWWLGFYISI